MRGAAVKKAWKPQEVEGVEGSGGLGTGAREGRVSQGRPTKAPGLRLVGAGLAWTQSLS